MHTHTPSLDMPCWRGKLQRKQIRDKVKQNHLQVQATIIIPLVVDSATLPPHIPFHPSLLLSLPPIAAFSFRLQLTWQLFFGIKRDEARHEKAKDALRNWIHLQDEGMWERESERRRGRERGRSAGKGGVAWQNVWQAFKLSSLSLCTFLDSSRRIKRPLVTHGTRHFVHIL